MKISIFRIVLPICVVGLTGIFLFPIIVTATNSFMTASEINNIYMEKALKAISLIPTKITLNQYYGILVDNSEYLGMFWNSAKLSLIIAVFHVFVALITAYGFAKIRFKGRDILFFIYIVTMMMPFQVTLLPNYIQAKMLHTFDTHLAIILPGIFAPFGVFLLRQFLRYVPDTFIEAVALESESISDVFIIAIIPSLKPGIIALAVLVFAENWNMVEQPMILLNSIEKYPLSVALNTFSQHGIDIVFAGSVLFMAPIFILFSYFEEYIVQGLENMKF